MEAASRSSLQSLQSFMSFVGLFQGLQCTKPCAGSLPGPLGGPSVVLPGLGANVLCASFNPEPAATEKPVFRRRRWLRVKRLAPKPRRAPSLRVPPMAGLKIGGTRKLGPPYDLPDSRSHSFQQIGRQGVVRIAQRAPSSTGAGPWPFRLTPSGPGPGGTSAVVFCRCWRSSSNKSIVGSDVAK